jgi:putative membrane protein
MKKLTLGSLLGLALLLGYGCNSGKKTDTVETAEQSNEAKVDSVNGPMEDSLKAGSDFLVKAASGGLMEVELGRMAEQKASNAEVKSFGSRMVKDHSQANEDLKALAAKKNITLPTAPGEDHQKHIADLKNLSGAEFDKQYVDMMVKDHQEDISLFEDATKDDKVDADVKAFAQKTLPVLKSHLQMVQGIDDKMKKQ